MNGSMTASLRLTLVDGLTQGLNKLKGVMDGLRTVGQRLGLGRLTDGASVLDRNARAAQDLSVNLKGVAGAADRAWASMKRMGSATASWGKKTFGPMSRTEAFTAAAEGFSVIEPIRSYAAFENIARHSAITEGFSGAAANAESNRLMETFRKDAVDTGQSSSSIAKAYQDLIQTGMTPDMAQKLLPIHSRAATAYNIDPEALGHAVAALQMNLGIGEQDMGGALASMALASKEGRFKVEDFSRFLPGITGNMAKLGMTGRASADTVFSALETVMKNSADPSTGATNFSDFMNYLTSPMAARSFALESKGMAPETKRVLEQNHITGIDMPALLADARKKGIDPVTAVVGTLKAKLQGLPPDVMAEVLGAFFHNQQARDAAQAMLMHSGEFTQMRGKLGTADPAMLARDFNTAFDAPQKKLDLFVEKLTQLGYKAGAAFVPVLVLLSYGLDLFSGALSAADRLLPGFSDHILTGIGGFFALSAGVAAVRMALPALSGALSILSGVVSIAWTGVTYFVAAIEGIVPALAGVAGVSAAAMGVIVSVVALFAAAAYDIYANWSTFSDFFAQMWQGVKDIFTGFAEFVGGLFLGDMDMAWQGIERVWSGVGEFFGGIWGTAKQLFIDFTSTLDGWTGGAITSAFNTIRDAVDAVVARFREWLDLLKVGRLLGFADTGAAGAPGAAATSDAGVPDASGTPGVDGPIDWSKVVPQGNVRVMVGVDPNGRLLAKSAESDSASVKVDAPDVNAGLMLGIP